MPLRFVLIFSNGREKLLPVSKTIKLGLPLMLALLGLEPGNARATTFLELQSTYLGDGWFQYQMTVMNDPFFAEADVTGLGITFTNEIEHSTTSTNWINSDWTNSYSGWSFTNGYPARPYTETFQIRSSETSYKMAATNKWEGAIFTLSLYFSELDPAMLTGIVSEDIAAYVGGVPCLVPCRPEEADGSPTNFVYVLKLLPDIQINQLILENGNAHGVDFTWNDPSTFLLQGSADLNNWTNIAYLWSYPPETIWTTNQSLGNYGQFFRLAIVSFDHTTNLPPLTSSLLLAPKTIAKVAITTPRVTGCRFANGKVVVNVAAQSGQMVQVRAMDSHGTTQQIQQAVAQGASVAVSFDAASLPSPLFFQAVVVQ